MWRSSKPSSGEPLWLGKTGDALDRRRVQGGAGSVVLDCRISSGEPLWLGETEVAEYVGERKNNDMSARVNQRWRAFMAGQVWYSER